MAKRAVLAETEIQSIVQAEIGNCDGTTNSRLANERSESLDYYFARPFGNEQDGRSKVVLNTVRDTIEWILPTLIRIFTSGEDVVEFEPEEERDIPSAKQATEYANFIWNRDNPGFLNFYSWFKDALLSKNGIVKIAYSTKDKTKRERYSGLSDEAFAGLVNSDDVKVSEHTEREEEITLPDLRPNAPEKVQKINIHDVVITRTEKCGRVCVYPTPPEEFLISMDARCIPEARLVGHKRKRTLSDLLEDGFDKAKVESLTSDDENRSTNQEEIARDTVERGASTNMVPTTNGAMREVWVYECYIKIDVDGDGIAEMRKVTVAGPGYTILSNDAWDAPAPFVSLTPIILPHRFYGLALADIIKDLQLISSTIMRQYLDNLYLSNNQREEVLVANIIDPSEALSSKPGQKIRTKNGPAISPILTPQIGTAALEGLTYIDQLRENRTGVSARTQGLGDNPLHDTARGEQMMMTAAMGKVELIARIFAETGVKDAFRLIHKLVCMYQDQPRTVRLTGKAFVPVDPRSWNADMDMTVRVGMGTGDKDQQMKAATLIAQAQAAVGQTGVLTVTPANAMATAEMLVNSTGQKGVDRFFTMPDPHAPPKPNPEMAKVQAQAEADKAKAQMDAQSKAQQSQSDAALKQQQQQTEAALSEQRMNREFELKRYQTDQELALKREQLAAELQLKREQMSAELALKREMGLMQAANDTSSDIGQVNVGGEPG